jgi:hypothetical protein
MYTAPLPLGPALIGLSKGFGLACLLYLMEERRTFSHKKETIKMIPISKSFELRPPLVMKKDF